MLLFVCIKFNGSNLLLVVQTNVPWSVGPVDTVWLIWGLMVDEKLENYIKLVWKNMGKPHACDACTL
jgi:hypothetical protein